MHFGVCYYPEHWPQERWSVDAQMMRDAGIDIVRIGEFAWSRMEPDEGRYDWQWLDDAIAVLADAGLQIVLGTPTATPPVWLTRRDPGILRVDADGRPRDHGTRRHYCPTDAGYRAHAARIVRAMAERYGEHPAVIGWQIDNEFGGGKTARCYCDDCRTAFSAWLREKYGSVGALNDGWGTVFWSQEYSDFGDITPPHAGINYQNPSHVLDFYRFASDSYVAFQQEQVDILRRLAPGRFVTHNFMGLYRDLDQFDLAAPLDFATWDNYPTGNPDRWRSQLYAPGSDFGRTNPTYAYDVGDPVITGLAHALTFGLKRAPFWVMEQQAGYINWGDVNPGVRDGTPRLWVWHAVSEGADTILFFRWRATVLAHEQYHSGLLRHDGTPDVGYRELQALHAERDQLAAVAAAPLDADVALLFDFADLWALQLQPHRRGFDYLRHHFLFYHALRRLGVNVHVVPSSADLSRYKLVIAPTLHLPSAETVARLTTYAEQGGTLLLGVRSGFKTPTNRVTDQPLPGLLRPLVGATVRDWQALPDGVDWELEPLIPFLRGAASFWVERLEPDGAQPLVRYKHDRSVAMTENAVGNGRVLYLGWYPIPDDMGELMAYLTRRLGLGRGEMLPAGLIMQVRGAHTVLMNFTDNLQTVNVGGQAVTVAPRNVRVLG